MIRILMIAALVFMALTSEGQSEVYGGVGGPYTPMKFVIDVDSLTPVEDSILTPRPNECRAELSAYGKTLSTVSES